MLWCYDNAIANDLSRCIDPDGGANSTVKVIGSEEIMGLIAQMKEDKIQFPLVCLTRDENVPIDTALANFVRLHRGVPIAYDSENNAIYSERCIPIDLSYTLNVLTTNTADRDEMIRELLFRYMSVYYIPVEIPYDVESRTIRIGVSIDMAQGIKQESGSLEYIQGGALYQSSMTFKCEGAVLLSYNSRHATRTSIDTTVQPQD